MGTTFRPERSNSSDTVGGDTCETSTPHGVRTWSVSRWKSRGPGLADLRSSTATTSPDSSRPSAPEAPRTRTSTVPGGSPTISSPSGMFWYSSGTCRLRSTDWSRVTVIHSNTAMTSASSFNQGLRKG